MYLVDTNFLGTLATRYPDDVFPSLWVDLQVPLFSGQVFFHQEVDEELARWGHPIYAWYASNRKPSQILVPDSEEIERYQEVTEWVAQSRRPAYKTSAVNQFLEAADSWLVASAYKHGATIVTDETPSPESKKRVKIPDVAGQFGIPCITALDFLRQAKISI